MSITRSSTNGMPVAIATRTAASWIIFVPTTPVRASRSPRGSTPIGYGPVIGFAASARRRASAGPACLIAAVVAR